ncbi:MAG: glycosyltransferase [Bacteroidales bacterium]
MSKLVLFTNAYPYGTGETFLHEELPFVARKFDQVVIFPLYIPVQVAGEELSDIILHSVPANVTVMDPLICFDHKDKGNLILHGTSRLFSGMEICEFLKKRVFLSGKKLWLFFNYTLLLNSILSNSKVIKGVMEELEGAKTAYFYWGDKSALMIPYLKKKVKNRPSFVVRFHGSDIYEEAKGYLPYRSYLYKALDYAVPISNSGAEYLKTKYGNSCPKNIRVHRLGSYEHTEESLSELGNQPSEVFHLVSCSNVIELKRVDLIAKALLNIEKDIRFIERMEEVGYKKIKWTHLGDGPLLESLKDIFKLNGTLVTASFAGRISHEKVIEFYLNNRADLFVQVSRSEGIPVSIMEALSYGVPVIATNVGGVKELFQSSDNNADASFKSLASTNTSQCLYGTLLAQDLTVSDLENAIKTFILLPDTTISTARTLARIQWEANWNSTKNYTAFADFLEGVC